MNFFLICKYSPKVGHLVKMYEQLNPANEFILLKKYNKLKLNKKSREHFIINIHYNLIEQLQI